MASVTLDLAYLHDAEIPSDYLVLGTDGPGHEASVGGEIRTYAAGRRRIITNAQQMLVLEVTFPWVTTAEKEQLEEWRGVLLMYRDVFERLLFGTYFTVNPVPHQDRSGWSVAVTFEESTHSIEA